MRTVKLGALLAMGLLAVPAAALADPGSPPPPPPGSTSIFSQMFGGHKSSATVTETNAARTSRAAAKPTADPSIKARDQELANWLRRAAVCTKLMEIADETGDESLRRKAEELDRRARTAFERRMGELGGEVDDFERDRRSAGTRSASTAGGTRKTDALKTEGGSE
jgi:hypothetical protein